MDSPPFGEEEIDARIGYEKSANPVQVLPRKVTVISQPVVDVAMSDYAMICLLDSAEVLCFHHDAHFKIRYAFIRRKCMGGNAYWTQFFDTSNTV